LVSDLASRVLKGDHRALAKAISIVEDGGVGRRRLIHELYPRTGKAFTIGVTGPTGTGKSTLVDKMIQEFRRRGRKVGVLAIDPSSPYTGGALLGDRIRMMDHSFEREVYIRSMASRGDVGGLARAAINTIRVLDAAGMDIVIVETVGAGQTEVQVATAVDATVVVVMPQLGDEVQAFKAGFNEIGDIFVVNKADRDGGRETVRELNQMIDFGAHLPWRPPVLEAVATAGTGVVQLWSALKAHRAHLESSGELGERRRGRLSREIANLAAERVRYHVEGEAAPVLGELVAKAERGEIDPGAAASELLAELGLTGA
jgi:LAO/AO transport system kinase